MFVATLPADGHDASVQDALALSSKGREVAMHVFLGTTHRVTSLLRWATVAAFAVVTLTFATALHAAERRDDLVHHFTIDKPGEWVTIELQPTTTVWYPRGGRGGAARVDDVRAVLGALKGVAIGTRCPGRTEGAVHYPCALDIDVRHHDGLGDNLEAWASTTTHRQTHPFEGTVSALSTPHPESGALTLAGDPSLLALIAPAALHARWAEDRPLQLRIRVRHAPVADDGTSKSRSLARTNTMSTQGVIVIGTQAMNLVQTAKVAQRWQPHR